MLGYGPKHSRFESPLGQLANGNIFLNSYFFSNQIRARGFKTFFMLNSTEPEVWFLRNVWCPAPMNQYEISSKWMPKTFILGPVV